MPPHHEAWLAAHPERSKQWFKRMLSEGFQVHHIDGDHSNNHPANLVLVEAVDHLRLHGMFGLVRFKCREMSSKGGRTRMSKLTPDQRRKMAKKAGDARWIAHRRRKRAEEQAREAL